jgi:hypothetical protein
MGELEFGLNKRMQATHFNIKSARLAATAEALIDRLDQASEILAETTRLDPAPLP